MKIELREPKTKEEWEQYYDLRYRVLRKQWNGEKQSSQGEGEDSAIHLAAWDGGKIAGAGRLNFLSPEEVQIKGMAVDGDFAGRGVGSLMLRGLEERAARLGARRVLLHARESALEFYRKNGYEVGNQSYTLFGVIAHWEMRKTL